MYLHTVVVFVMLLQSVACNIASLQVFDSVCKQVTDQVHIKQGYEVA